MFKNLIFFDEISPSCFFSKASILPFGEEEFFCYVSTFIIFCIWFIIWSTVCKYSVYICHKQLLMTIITILQSISHGFKIYSIQTKIKTFYATFKMPLNIYNPVQWLSTIFHRMHKKKIVCQSYFHMTIITIMITIHDFKLYSVQIKI